MAKMLSAAFFSFKYLYMFVCLPLWNKLQYKVETFKNILDIFNCDFLIKYMGSCWVVYLRSLIRETRKYHQYCS